MSRRLTNVSVKDRIALVAVLLCFAALPVAAQTTFGRISGTVTDQTSAAVPGVKVTVRNTGTQDIRVVTTDADGYYVAPELAIGAYTVEVTQAGFKPQEQTGVNISADSRLTVDFHLQVGDVRQSVEVVAANAEMLNATSGEIAHVIDQEQVENLHAERPFLRRVPHADSGRRGHQPRPVRHLDQPQRHQPVDQRPSQQPEQPDGGWRRQSGRRLQWQPDQ